MLRSIEIIPEADVKNGCTFSIVYRGTVVGTGEPFFIAETGVEYEDVTASVAAQLDTNEVQWGIPADPE